MTDSQYLLFGLFLAACWRVLSGSENRVPFNCQTLALKTELLLFTLGTLGTTTH